MHIRVHVCDMCSERWDIKLQENNDQNIIIWYRPRAEAVGKGQLGIASPLTMVLLTPEFQGREVIYHHGAFTATRSVHVTIAHLSTSVVDTGRVFV